MRNSNFVRHSPALREKQHLVRNLGPRLLPPSRLTLAADFKKYMYKIFVIFFKSLQCIALKLSNCFIEMLFFTERV